MLGAPGRPRLLQKERSYLRGRGLTEFLLPGASASGRRAGLTSPHGIPFIASPPADPRLRRRGQWPPGPRPGSSVPSPLQAGREAGKEPTGPPTRGAAGPLGRGVPGPAEASPNELASPGGSRPGATDLSGPTALGPAPAPEPAPPQLGSGSEGPVGTRAYGHCTSPLLHAPSRPRGSAPAPRAPRPHAQSSPERLRPTARAHPSRRSPPHPGGQRPPEGASCAESWPEQCSELTFRLSSACSGCALHALDWWEAQTVLTILFFFFFETERDRA